MELVDGPCGLEAVLCAEKGLGAILARLETHGTLQCSRFVEAVATGTLHVRVLGWMGPG